MEAYNELHHEGTPSAKMKRDDASNTDSDLNKSLNGTLFDLYRHPDDMTKLIMNGHIYKGVVKSSDCDSHWRHMVNQWYAMKEHFLPNWNGMMPVPQIHTCASHSMVYYKSLNGILFVQGMGSFT